MKKWECTVCGYIHEGDSPPDICPVCGAGAEYFKEVVDQSVTDKTADSPAADPAAGPTAPPPPQPDTPTGLVKLVLDYHLHPITVHTPNGVLPLALIFLLLALVFTHAVGFEQAAFFNLIFVLLTMPAVIATGYLEWKNRYKGVMTKIFATKIAASVVVCTTLPAMVIWRVLDPQVLAGPGRWIYLLLGVAMVGAAGLAGHMGGKLVFGRR